MTAPGHTARMWCSPNLNSDTLHPQFSVLTHRFRTLSCRLKFTQTSPCHPFSTFLLSSTGLKPRSLTRNHLLPACPVQVPLGSQESRADPQLPPEESLAFVVPGSSPQDTPLVMVGLGERRICVHKRKVQKLRSGLSS
jgi:hypothetical protein